MRYEQVSTQGRAHSEPGRWQLSSAGKPWKAWLGGMENSDTGQGAVTLSFRTVLWLLVWRVSQGQNWRQLWSQEGGAGGWGGGALKGLGLYRMVRKVGFGALEPDCLGANPSSAAY